MFSQCVEGGVEGWTGGGGLGLAAVWRQTRGEGIKDSLF